MHRTRTILAVAALALTPLLAACSHDNGKTTVKVPSVKIDPNNGKKVEVPDPHVSNDNGSPSTTR